MKLIIAIAAALLGMTTITTSAQAQWSTSGHPHVVVVPAERGWSAPDPWRDQLAIRTERLATDANAFTSFATQVVSYPHTNQEGAEFVRDARAFDRAARSGASINELMRTLPQLASEQREFTHAMLGFLSTADMTPTIAEVQRLARRLNDSMEETQNLLLASERAERGTYERDYAYSYPVRVYPPAQPRYVYAPAPSRVQLMPARGIRRIHRGHRVAMRFGF